MFRSSLGRNWKRWSKLYSHQFSLVTPSRRGLDQLAWSTNFNSTRSSIMVFPVFLFTTKERSFRSIDKTSRKGPTKWVAKEKTEWNNQNWPLLCGFWIVLKLWWRHPTAANRIHSAIKQSTLIKDGMAFRLHDISKCGAVNFCLHPCWCHFLHLLRKTLYFVDEQCL